MFCFSITCNTSSALFIITKFLTSTSILRSYLAQTQAPKPTSACQTDESSFVKSDAELRLGALNSENKVLKDKCLALERDADSQTFEIKRLAAEIESSRKHTAHMEEELMKATSIPKHLSVASPKRSETLNEQSFPSLLSFTAVLRDLNVLKIANAGESASVSAQVRVSLSYT